MIVCERVSSIWLLLSVSLIMLFVTLSEEEDYFKLFASDGGEENDKNNFLQNQEQTKNNPENVSITYQNPIHNFTLSYPSNWKLIETDNGVSITPPSLENGSSDSFQENLLIEVLNRGNLDLREIVSSDVVDLKKDLPSFRLINSKIQTISGIPWYIILYSYDIEGQTNSAMHIWSMVAGKLFSISYMSKAARFAENLPKVQQVVDSLTLTLGNREMERQEIEESILSGIPKLYYGGDPFALTMNEFTRRLYVTNLRLNTISVIDASTDELLADVEVGNSPSDVDVNDKTNRIYVTNSRSNTVSVISGRSNEVVDTLEVGNQPGSMVIDNSERGLDGLGFVTNFLSNRVSVIDLSKDAVIANLSVGREPDGVAINSITNRLYVANSGSDSVSVFDYFLTSNGGLNITQIAVIKVGNKPTGLAFDENTNILYVTNSDSNAVSVIDGSTNAIVANVAVGINPTDIDLNNAEDRIYVSNYGSASVSVLDAATTPLYNTIVEIPVGRFPAAMYLDRVSNVLYTSVLGSNSITEVRNTSVVAGIRFSIDPPNAGQIECNNNRISDPDYLRVDAGLEFDCTATANSNFGFISWSGGLEISDPNAESTKIRATDYGNVTANYDTAISFTLPEDYFQQLFIILISAIIPSTLSGAAPTIAGWYNRRKQRKYFRLVLDEVQSIIDNDELSANRNELLKYIESKTSKWLSQGKLSEVQYEILNDKISNYKNQ